MVGPGRMRDRADDSLLTLIGDVPELVRNLVLAEVAQAKAWVASTAKDYGIGAGWLVGALMVLFWSIPVFGTAAIAGLAVAWPVWLSALVIGAAMILIILVLVLLGLARFKKAAARENPLQAAKEDVSIVREARDEY
ncbi:phage holin family protein [Microbacterium sp. LRZ72]|uniref:phage holin family protein n=1 Tax=Microbacterium sp. LRZ72 TaxID=2942481 RepID=UPI0029ABBED6|nr:phage holin family protein [Microbacterium sp. LRZ72]MDX2376412.1 phage holin family protein [Microbacterium sp. LRZ72]